MSIIDSLVIENSQKIVFLILDGLGDVPHKDFGYKTPLEAAKKPSIDEISRRYGILGRGIPVDVGITPGSGPGHLSLFGYDPIAYDIGRGVLEVLGMDMELNEGDVAARGNFCTVKNKIVLDRRAGRLETEETERLISIISNNIKTIDGVEIILRPGKSHRFALILRGDGLSDKLTDADPHKEGMEYVYPEAREKDAIRTANVLRKFIDSVSDILANEERANGILLRGFSKKPDIPSFTQRYRMRALALASYPMYRGIARLLGMEIREKPETIKESFELLSRYYSEYQFFFLHVKETDIMGEDGNFYGKVKVIEEVDSLIPSLWELGPNVLVITSDHSTPCTIRGHSWHPVPILLASRNGESDNLEFTERNCLRGSIGTIYSKNLMNLVLALGSKLDKFGA